MAPCSHLEEKDIPHALKTGEKKGVGGGGEEEEEGGGGQGEEEAVEECREQLSLVRAALAGLSKSEDDARKENGEKGGEGSEAEMEMLAETRKELLEAEQQLLVLLKSQTTQGEEETGRGGGATRSKGGGRGQRGGRGGDDGSGVSSSRFTFGWCSLVGRRRKNEDRLVVGEKIRGRKGANGEGGGGGGGGGYFFGLYDGHGGVLASEFARRHLHQHVERAWRGRGRNGDRGREEEESEDDGGGEGEGEDGEAEEETILSRALVQGFLQCDKNFLLQADKANSPAGTTALALIVREEEEGGEEIAGGGEGGGGFLSCVVANCGDCRLIHYSSRVTTSITVDHKPEMESERRRIEKRGGIVVQYGSVWRVCNRRDAMAASERHNRVLLSVSRGLGDLPLKKPEKVVTAVPEVYRIRLGGKGGRAGKNDDDEEEEEDLEFLVLGCDGVFDVLSNAEVSQAVLTGLAEGGGSKAAAEMVGRRAYDKGSEDNITVIVILMRRGEGHGKCEGKDEEKCRETNKREDLKKERVVRQAMRELKELAHQSGGSVNGMEKEGGPKRKREEDACVGEEPVLLKNDDDVEEEDMFRP